jgi:hypothetical protein
MGAGAKAAAPATAAKNKTDLRMLCSMMQKTEALLLLYDAVSLQDPANSKMHLSTIYFCTKGKYFISLSKWLDVARRMLRDAFPSRKMGGA